MEKRRNVMELFSIGRESNEVKLSILPDMQASALVHEGIYRSRSQEITDMLLY